MPDVLRLETTEFTDPTRWRWRLTGADTGAFLAGRDVELARSDWQFEAFRDLRHYVSWHANGDTYEAYAADEAQIVTAVGTWIGDQAFGAGIMNALARHRNATVRVTLPAGAEPLAFLPLELARADGQTLASLGITLVIETGRAPDRPPNPVGERLRVLGLFSLPEQSSPLNLRRERQSLLTLIRTIAANGRAADVKVLQYGVTRDRLRDVLTEAEGWDIIHVSGHGAPGELLLETASGGPDRITADDLADLLDTARDRVKLVTLAACWSAARTADEQRRLLRLPVPNQDQTRSPTERIAATAQSPSALATELTTRLGCAVLAMRYPVADDFAIALTVKLYDLLLRQGQPLPRAVTMTQQHLANGASRTDRADRKDGTGERRYPALSLASPAIFGATASGLILRAPDRAGPASYATETLKMAGFPDPPDRFVGRTGVMARASAALAAESRVPGVLLHGMPGGGKTACALELAYTHEDAFDRLAWFKAPDEGTDISAALTDFALRLERDLPGFQMVHVLADEQKLDAFLPRLTELVERNRLLIVIDNAESLLTATGHWRDQRWGSVVAALTAHAGLGRIILTSRRLPVGTPDAIARDVSAETRPGLGLLVEAVDALSLDEALLLARELPNLRTLIYAELPGIDRDVSRSLALGVLNVAQGHPKLLELANGQAQHPERLAELVESGDQAWRDQDGLPDGFFTTGETTADPGDYLHVLAAWTESVTATLSPGERDLFWFLCCLEEPDRKRSVIEGNWAELWERLSRDGQPPALDRGLAELAARGLAAIRASGSSGKSYKVHVHPGVSAAGRNHAGHDFQVAVDTDVGDFWDAAFQYASGENDDGRVNTTLLVRAGLAAVPYLLRRERWDHAVYLLERAFLPNPSRASAAAILPAITRITAHDPRHENTLALIWEAIDPDTAETRYRDSLEAADARGDCQAAAAAAGRLVDLCLDGGRLAEALTLTDTMAIYTRQAGLGPWTQLSNQVQRLQILAEMGHADHVLDEVRRLRSHMDILPGRPGPDEAVPPWNTRETLLNIGSHAAIQLGRWQDALDLNAEITASQHARHAPAREMARTRFGDYGPLLRLGRTDEALDLLLECRQVFHDTGDIEALGATLSALANTEDKRGHDDAALRLERDALRYAYLNAKVTGIATSYHNLGNFLHRHARQPAAALSAHLTAALIFALTCSGGTGGGSGGTAAGSVRAAAADLREFGAAAEPPADIADLCDRLADIEGTDLPALIEQLSPDPETAEQTLRDLIAQARQLAEAPPGDPDHE
ncbi:MAG: CHAT domain-containing protein [Nocardiopsaceae bacterium]|nr:CHAT domain-containing protein [Nocardiopsaceae bacterium]